MVTLSIIEEFLKNKEIAVIGASTNKKKFGNLVIRSLKKRGFSVYPVNPGVDMIEGVKCFPDTISLPSIVKAAVFITKPEVTERIVECICNEKIIIDIWFQQGSESKKAIFTANQHALNVVHNECILMFTKSSSFPHNIHHFFKRAFGKYPK